MPLTETQRELKRRKRRRKKLKELRRRLAESNDLKRRTQLLEKIEKLSPFAVTRQE